MISISRTLQGLVLVVLTAAFSTPADAQRLPRGGGGGSTPTPDKDLTPQLEWDKRAEIDFRLTAHGMELLGDSIDQHTGSISFRHTDISLPGNSALPVSLTRELTQGYFYHFKVDAEFGDWNYVVPRIHVVTAEQPGGAVTDWAGARCSNPQSAFTVVQYSGATGPNSFAYPVEYSNGLLLDVPGYGSQQVLAKSPNVTLPFPSSARFITAQNWYLTCGSANDGSEGFIAIAPNGDRYRFDRYIQHRHRSLGSITPDGGNAGPSYVAPRVRAMLMATEVTDVHGNWVRYSYDSAGRLTRIYANDGRSITIAYIGSSNLIASATANGRTWTYGYATETVVDDYLQLDSTTKQILTSVTQPDGQSWSFNLLHMHRRAYAGTYCTNLGGSMSLTHPNGVTGTFDIAETHHRRGYAEWMTETTLRCSGAFVNLRTPTYYDIYHSPLEVMSVTRKTLSGNKIPTSQWTYSYESDVVEQRYPAGHQYEGHPIATSQNDPTNWTKVLNPDGSETTYYHYWQTLMSVPGADTILAGKLDRRETRSSPGGTVLETQDNNYVQTGTFGYTYVPNSYSGSPLADILVPRSTGTPVQISQSVVSRDGDTFTTDYSYDTNQGSSSYSYGYPTQTNTRSNVSTSPRSEAVTYEHNSASWVLGLPKTITLNGLQTDLYAYYSNGALKEHYKYGTRVAHYDRYASGPAAGQISAVWDGLNRKTELLNWKRGTPQQIKRADMTSVYQYVDNNGWLTSTVDARGNTATFSRDNMGRITFIDLPGPWASTTINYNFSGGGAVQTVTKSQSRTTTTYDELFRPILERSHALDTGWSSYVNTLYDSSGRMTFESQPSSSPSATAGFDYTYDALGRIRTETETVSPYASTRHTYHASHRHRVTDQSNAWTDYYSYGYDGPGNANYRAVYHSSGQRTYIYKNVSGEIYRVGQWGTQNGYSASQNQYYYYDSNRRLCRYYTPEQGATKFQYDAAGQLTAYSKGHANSGCTVATDNSRVSLTYDPLGRLTTTDFADPTTPDIFRDHDPDGNVLYVNRSGVNWTYTYNELNLLDSETLRLDGRTYAISYLYENDGSLKRKTHPSGRQVNYETDGLGRFTTVRNGSATLASGITYHPSSAVQGFTYGNGQVLSHTLNNRLFTQRLRTTKPGNTAIDLTYSYDVRGKVTGITDAAVSGNNRVYGYDSLGRLTNASGPWGTGSYVYDALNNLRSKTLGSRTVTTTYDSSTNRLTQSIDPGQSGTRNFEYDARGNVTSLGGMAFGYDYSDQPVSVSGTTTGTYKYDGNLKRVKTVADGKTIYNVFDSNGGLVYVDELTDGKRTDYVEGAMGTLARIENNVVTYLHPDHLGSAQSGTNSSGTIVWREQYTPFGEERQGASANDDQAGFTGHIKDSATGLNYMQARYYDPVVGRFLSIDPETFISSGQMPALFNRYAYSANDPVNHVDPDGKILKLAKAGFNIARRTIKNGGNLKKGVADELASLTDNVSTLADDELNVDDAFAALDLLTGFGSEAKRVTNRVSVSDGVPNSAARPREGIYEFPDQAAGGTPYVGQSSNIPNRLKQHEAAGRLKPGTESTTEVLGGKTTREVAEHRRIQDLTNGVPARHSPDVSNKVDPIGPARRHLLDEGG